MIVRARAPLRLGLAGGGTDVSPYCDVHGGHVMNATIDKFAYATIDQPSSTKSELCALDSGATFSGEAGQPLADAPGVRLLAGTYNRICRDYLGGEYPPLRIRTASDAPPGSGLGSSSTLVQECRGGCRQVDRSDASPEA